MGRFERFTILLTKDERQIIVNLANYLDRTQSDTVRLLLHSAANSLKISPSKEKTKNQEAMNVGSAHS